MVNKLIRLPLCAALLLAGGSLGGCATDRQPGAEACIDCYVPGYRRQDARDRYYHHDRFYDPFWGPTWYGPGHWGWYAWGWPRYVIIDRPAHPAPAPPAQPSPPPERPAIPRPPPRDPGRVPQDEGPRLKPKPHYDSPKRRKGQQQEP